MLHRILSEQNNSAYQKILVRVWVEKLQCGKIFAAKYKKGFLSRLYKEFLQSNK